MQRARSVIDQVVDNLLEIIRNNEVEGDGRLPPESKLAEELGVSRTTLRTALTKLEADGLVTRRQGDGTFINKRVMEVSTKLGGIWDFKCLIEESGRKPLVKNISINVRTATLQDEDALDLSGGEKVIEMVRLFFADDQPVIFSTNIFPFKYLNNSFNPQEFDVSLPIHDLLKKYFGQEISYSISDISAVLATAELAPILKIKAGSPLFQFCDLFYNAHDQPLMSGLNFYDDKVIRMRVARSWG